MNLFIVKNFHKLKFSILSENCREKIVELRKLEYQRHFKNRINEDFLNWNNADSRSIQLGLIFNDELVAVIRFSLVMYIETFESMTQFKIPAGTDLPCVILSRGATRSGWQNLGLHSLLRLWCLHMCRTQNFQSVWGTLEMSAHRLKSLQKLGYQIASVKDIWTKSNIRSTDGVALIKLPDQSAILSAAEKLQQFFLCQGLDIKLDSLPKPEHMFYL